MKRTKECIRIPDAINCSVTKNFTQVPNDLLRNPDISGKAKALLCILLSNKDGWVSYITALRQVMKEAEGAIRSAISELEEHRYLMRVRYRTKDTKKWVGSFWVYSDTPGVWDLQEQEHIMHEQELEMVVPENPHVGNPDVGNPNVGNPTLKRPIIKRPNEKKTESSPSKETEYMVSPKHFGLFWKMYPKKPNKGAALTAWNKLCRKDDRPTWPEIKKALHAQKKTEQWQNPKLIPHPTTWINQSRWLDDPAEMVSYRQDATKPNTIGHRDKNEDGSYRQFKEFDDEI